MAVSAPISTPQLAEELDTARQLMALLKKEQALLIDASIGALDPLVGEKTSLIARLSELSQVRLRALSQAGYPPEESSMQIWLDDPASSSDDKLAVRQTWEDLLALVRSAKEVNRINGLLIDTHLSHNKAALHVLQNNQADQVYGRDGQTSTQASRRSFVVG